MLGSAVKHDYTVISEKNPSKKVGKDIDGGATIFPSFACFRLYCWRNHCLRWRLIATAGHDLTNLLIF